MFSPRSCSPYVMKIFWPVIRHVPSGAGTARVLIAPTSLPACDSVRFMVAGHSPVTIRRTYVSCCTSSP